MLNEIEVRELVCGVSSEDKISEVRDWIKKMQQMDQDLFASQVISLDVEDVKVAYYDTLRMAGKLSTWIRKLSMAGLKLVGDRCLVRSCSGTGSPGHA